MIPNPLALIAEITHRCPLHCVYCSNPTELAAVGSELSTEEWMEVFEQAGRLGVLHAHFTGGEPLARPDLTELITTARAAGLYTNLITSGIGLAEARLQTLVEASGDQFVEALFVERQTRSDQADVETGGPRGANEIGEVGTRERLAARKVDLKHAEFGGFAQDANPRVGGQFAIALR